MKNSEIPQNHTLLGMNWFQNWANKLTLYIDLFQRVCFVKMNVSLVTNLDQGLLLRSTKNSVKQ